MQHYRERLVTLNCYSNQIRYNDHEDQEYSEPAWFTVPIRWARMKALKQGYNSFTEFILNYTWDDTDGWVYDARKDGQLRAYGHQSGHGIIK
ncbi:hypothetical protein DALLNEIH_03775 [Bacillus sp. B01(2024)]